jgi:hypothetical protein
LPMQSGALRSVVTEEGRRVVSLPAQKRHAQLPARLRKLTASRGDECSSSSAVSNAAEEPEAAGVRSLLPSSEAIDYAYSNSFMSSHRYGQR